MIAEINFEKDTVVKYIVDDLGYTQIPHTEFNSQLLMIPSVVKDFLLSNNRQLIKEIIKYDFAGDENKFWQDFLLELSKYLYDSKYNIANTLNPSKHKSFKFAKKYTFILFYAYDKVIEDKNFYHVANQICIDIPNIKGGKLLIKPDVGIFVNGFLFSSVQLKMTHKGQTAMKEGRGQIINDYFEAALDGVIDHITPNMSKETIASIVCRALKAFHGQAYWVAMDMDETYVLRGLNKYYPDIEKALLASRAGGADIKKQIESTFLIEPICKKEKHLDLKDKLYKILYSLFSKEMIQKEILYYNHTRYESVSEYEKGKKTIKNKVNTPISGYPRPNQKYGVNKVLNRVEEFYDNESNPEYELERLKAKLISDNMPERVVDSILEKRRAYKNNRTAFSILLQYAAGFGKTNIICWLALMLKDLKEKTLQNKTREDYLFKKIILLSDRVELRDQVDLAMDNMNISKGLYAEANTTAQLVKFLKDKSTRIIIVNIQKFPFLSDMKGQINTLFNDERVAIIIDEIHRSNSGIQHNEMTTLFDDIANIICDDGVDIPKKKNLIIGLTATPTDENLARFGEYQGCYEQVKWMPFDSYTMTEAQQDGFVLKVDNRVVPYALEHLVNTTTNPDARLPNSKVIYESIDSYIVPVAKRVAKILFGTTYRKIGGYGKGMITCYSVQAAKDMYKYLTLELEALSKDPKNTRFKDSKVYMVYSGTQDEQPAHKICGYDSEKATIAAFKSSKNGIMIVVDKLQTGFDEPKLHTLFLAKETKGINAVQTLCRVNRTTKNKEDCLVVDFSINNKNVGNIKNAFEKYAGIVTSTFDTYSIREDIHNLYKTILASEPYVLFFNRFNTNSDMNLAFDTETYVKKMLANEYSKEILIQICDDYLTFMHKVGLVNNVIGLEDKYKDKELAKFMVQFITLVKGKLHQQNSKNQTEIVDFWLEDIGVINKNEIEELDDIETGFKIGNKKLNNSTDVVSQYNIVSEIAKFNKEQEGKESLIKGYEDKLTQVFDTIISLDEDKNDKRLYIKIKTQDNSTTDEDIREDFSTLLRQTTRRLRGVDGMDLFVETISENKTVLENDFIEYILNKKE